MPQFISRAVAGGSRKGRCSHLARMFVLLALYDRACNRDREKLLAEFPGHTELIKPSYGKERIAEPSTTGPGQCHSGCRRTPLAPSGAGRSIIVGHTMSTDKRTVARTLARRRLLKGVPSHGLKRSTTWRAKKARPFPGQTGSPIRTFSHCSRRYRRLSRLAEL